MRGVFGLTIAALSHCAAGTKVVSRQCAPSAHPPVTRRGLLVQSAALVTLAPSLPVLAEVRGANSNMPKGNKEAAAFLKAQGLPAMPTGDGLSPMVQYIGTAPPANIDGSKVKERAFSETLLVRFLYPSGWLVETPTLTENGEAGKIAANNYQKGDSADFVAIKLPKDATLDSLTKESFKGLVSSQMTNDVFEDIKIKKLKQVAAADGTEMALIDFTYTLLTRAGFTVERRGVASASVVAGSIVGLVMTTTSDRFKGLEVDFRKCVDSFRAYSVKAPAFDFAV